MTDSLKQSLSALLDNEAESLELRRVLKAAGSDAELRRTWHRFNLQQSVLHGHNVGRLGEDFDTRVMRALEQETMPSRSRFGQLTVKFAIAASVALVAFVGLQTALLPDPAAPAVIAEQEATAPVPFVAGIAPVGEDPVRQEVDPVARQRLEDYINSVAITPARSNQLEYIQDSPLYRLVNEVRPADAGQ